MHLILARHGNTFDPGERPVWVGARTDLPLVEKGRRQARMIGDALNVSGLIPRRILTGPLKRTLETATIALSAFGGREGLVQIDERLREIDYGLWEGKSSDEIQRSGGEDELRAWERDSVWPANAGWPESRSEFHERLANVLQGIRQEQDDPVLVVSSNGVFKLLGTSISDRLADGKTATGHLALLRLEGDRVEILGWNLAPEAFPECVARCVAL